MTRKDIEEMDPGLARERTELAWTRTAISFAAIGGIVLKQSVTVGLVILGMSGLIFLLGHLSRPSERSGRHENRSALLLVTLAVTAVSATALVTVFLSHGSPIPRP